MTFPIKRKKPVYLGSIIVCLDKARPYSEIEGGRVMLGDLTHFNIRTSSIKSKFSQTKNQSYTEREIAVPVFMCNRDSPVKGVLTDWTKLYSPITEIQCMPLQRWWPRSIFKGSQKIGDIAEEIVIEHSKYTIEFQVTYAYTSDLKELFSDIDGDIKEQEEEKRENKIDSVLDSVTNIIPSSPSKAIIVNDGPSDIVDEVEENEERALAVIPSYKSKWKYVIGSTAIILIVVGIFFGVKWLNRPKD
jgi:hypothetical protein